MNKSPGKFPSPEPGQSPLGATGLAPPPGGLTSGPETDADWTEKLCLGDKSGTRSCNQTVLPSGPTYRLAERSTALENSEDVPPPGLQVKAPLHAKGALSGGLEKPALDLPDQGHLGLPEVGLKDFELLPVDPEG